MAQIEKKIAIYDQNGFVKLQTIMVDVEEPIQSVEEMISQKEEQLLQMYQELQSLKDKQS